MTIELLSDTVGAHFAGRVNRLLDGYMSISEHEYDVAADECRLWTTVTSNDMGQSMTSLEAKLRARTRVKTVSIFVCKKGGFRIDLHGCMDEYKRWSQMQLRIRNTDRLLYFMFGLFVAGAGFIFYLFHR